MSQRPIHWLTAALLVAMPLLVLFVRTTAISSAQPPASSTTGRVEDVHVRYARAALKQLADESV